MPRPGRPELRPVHRRHALTWLGAVAAGSLVGCSGSADPSTGSGASTGTPTREPASSRPRTTASPTDPLTGAAEVSTHPVVAVKIDNTAAAMPQVGLSRADHVWVQEVEGGLTRLVAIFHTRLPDAVGPVRSARSTDVELLPVYGKPLLVYSGANRDVQRRLGRSGLPTATSGAGFGRVGSRDAPYDLMADLAAVTARRKLRRASNLGLRFAADDPRWTSADRQTAFTGSVGSGKQRFAYADGAYRVSTDGRAITEGGRPVVTENVVIMTVVNEPDGNADVNGARSVRSRTVGSGRVTVHRDGRRGTGRWKRTSLAGDLALTDADGQPITLTPGRTWFLLSG